MDLSHMKEDFPVPVQFKERLPEDLRTIHERNDTKAFYAAMDWMGDFHEYVGPRADPERRGSSLVLVGPPGTGKTMMASAIMNRVTGPLHKTAAFIQDDQLDRLLQMARYSRMDEQDSDVVFAMENVALVVVDDALRLGGTAEFLEPFLRLRSTRGKPTIITLNSGVALPDALTSFLHSWTWASFTGPDQRRI